jgi:hypothetical protein
MRAMALHQCRGTIPEVQAKVNHRRRNRMGLGGIKGNGRALISGIRSAAHGDRRTVDRHHEDRDGIRDPDLGLLALTTSE